MSLDSVSITEIIILFILFSTVLPVLVQALRNVSVYKKCRKLTEQEVSDINNRGKLVSIVIPARNEEHNIRKVVDSALKSDDTNIEILIGNDHSSDATGSIADTLASEDNRIKHIQVPELPSGWGGKMHTCWATAQQAKGDWLMFIDADVTISPSAVSRMLAEAEKRDIPFLSGFPYQVTGTIGEKTLIPMIFFILLSFLSIRRMRKSVKPAYAASCGQIMLIESETYNNTGGHKTIKHSCHDGLDMPRMFRRNKLKTDLADLSDIIVCRMYHSTWDTCVGLEKNAKYGLGSPRLIFVFTFMLIVGQVLPWLFAAWLSIVYFTDTQPFWERIFIPEWRLQLQVLAFILLGLSGFLIRWIHCKLHGCSGIGALLHPVGVLWLMGIQWVALIRSILGKKSTWKGRKVQ